ncbi:MULTISPECIES: NADPH-dependent F420 reductase [Methanoculleus]|jgi:NADPH-dependent F420 reductase|uniref:Reduced coenzyme F420:NADP oxidoreductase n=1 Tax=Methanoculleus thermophilus TaxID=2200 RepID=A0A1G8YW50_9EURY|nr:MULTISPECIES: NADPH-dependent F420 reductase [Methanoculleus]NLN08602.1 NADPH-dependent F420 reductase [Methanoculleus thermophilus]SDK07082.1 reduced coenzyme F420:NADP oxidoreductase [Methanoculleus thermophilus]HQD24935.1 NADPH-dependent F420 reductase [Methanoculleus thermophilus]
MKIGIVGGTGEIGEGMALRLSPKYDVIVGSREETKAIATCDACRASLEERDLACNLLGVTNQRAIDEADVVILAIPFRHVAPTLKTLTGFEDKIVISPVNPIERTTYFYYAPPPEGSAAMMIKGMLPESAIVCAAFNNVAANKWRALDEVLDYSVAVCCDDDGAKRTVMDLVNSVSSLRAYDAGPLHAASIVESLTPLLLNIARFNGMKDVGVRFV